MDTAVVLSVDVVYISISCYGDIKFQPIFHFSELIFLHLKYKNS